MYNSRYISRQNFYLKFQSNKKFLKKFLKTAEKFFNYAHFCHIYYVIIYLMRIRQTSPERRRLRALRLILIANTAIWVLLLRLSPQFIAKYAL